MGAAFGARQRQRYGCGDDGTNLRPLLYDEAAWQGHWLGAFHGSRDRKGARRAVEGGQRAWQGIVVRNLLASGTERGLSREPARECDRTPGLWRTDSIGG